MGSKVSSDKEIISRKFLYGYNYFDFIPSDIIGIIASFLDNRELLSIISFAPDNNINWNMVYYYRFRKHNIKKMSYDDYLNILAAEVLIKELQLKYTPERLINIKKLDLSDNEELAIKDRMLVKVQLPKEIGNLINLEYLDLSDNKLRELPKEIGNLINLKTLDVSYNKLTELPSSIKNLVNLKVLNIVHNRIMRYKQAEIRKLLPNTKILSDSDIPPGITNRFIGYYY